MSRDVRIPVMLRTRKFILLSTFHEGIKKARKNHLVCRDISWASHQSPPAGWCSSSWSSSSRPCLRGRKEENCINQWEKSTRATTGRICDWPMGDEHRAAIVICNWPMGEEHSATAWDLWLAKEIWAQRNYSGLWLTNGRRAQRNFRDLWLTNERTAQGWL